MNSSLPLQTHFWSAAQRQEKSLPFEICMIQNKKKELKWERVEAKTEEGTVAVCPQKTTAYMKVTY